VVTAELRGPTKPLVHGMVRRLEGDEQHGAVSAAGAVEKGLHRVEQPAIRRE
jgi:hypothetical protein